MEFSHSKSKQFAALLGRMDIDWIGNVRCKSVSLISTQQRLGTGWVPVYPVKSLLTSSCHYVMLLFVSQVLN